MYLNVDRQGCVIKTVAYSLRTDRHTDTGTDKSLKTEGPKILSNDIFYFRTVIIGGPITASNCKYLQHKYGTTRLSYHNFGVQSADRHTHSTHTLHGQTKRKTED